MPYQFSGFMFSKACKYGIKAAVFIAIESMQNRRVKLPDVVENIGSPEAFTAKILSQLTKANIIRSVKGPYGGFEIEKERLNQIKVKAIVEAIDGNMLFSACGMGFLSCGDENPCPLHFKYTQVRNEINKMLDSTTLLEMATDVKNQKTKLLIS